MEKWVSASGQWWLLTIADDSRWTQSSGQSGELSQRLCHDYDTVNIVLVNVSWIPARPTTRYIPYKSDLIPAVIVIKHHPIIHCLILVCILNLKYLDSPVPKLRRGLKFLKRIMWPWPPSIWGNLSPGGEYLQLSEFNACQTPRSMYPSIFNHFWDIARHRWRVTGFWQFSWANECFYHILASPVYAPGTVAVNVKKKENSMLVKCIAACTHLSSTVYEL